MTIDSNTPPTSDVFSVDSNARPIRKDEQVDPPDNLPMGTPAKDWSAAQAKRVVKADFDRAASWRATNIESKWQESMDTYTSAKGGEKYWEGTSTPRANLDVHQAFQQINALRPQVLDALCGSDLDFDVEAAKSGTTIGQLHMVRQLMQYQMKSLGGRVKFQTWRSCLDKLTEDGLVLANGIWEWGWDGPRTVQVPKWKKVPEYAPVPHPAIPGMLIHAPTGRMIAHQGHETQTISNFTLDPVDLVDFYIDPNTRGPNVQLGEFCARRKMMTVAEIASYRGLKGWDVPDDKTLYTYAKKKFSTDGDTSRQNFMAATGVNYQPNEDQSIDPRLARLEVIRYWQKDRHVWLLARDHVMWNSPNQYEALPFFNWCYVNKPGQFYGFSIPELLRTDQKLIKTLLEGRLDELNLILHPPFISKRGTFRSQGQSKLRPGANWEADDPSKDIQRVEMGNVTQTAYIEVNEAENRGQKKTGVTDLAVLGSPTAGGNSANRTATGVQAQTSASNSRVHGLVATIEDTVVGCMLEQMWTVCKMYLDPNQVLEIIGQDGAALQLDPVDILNSDPRFKMKTANNMKMRAAMQNGGLQQLTQYVLNPEIMTLNAEQQGKILDIPQFTEFFLDVYNVRAFSMYRDMTPQEQQAMQQRQQQSGQEKMQLQQSRLQSMSADAHERDETAILTAILAPLVTQLAKDGAFNGIAGLPSGIALEAKRLQAEIDGGQYDAAPAGAK